MDVFQHACNLLKPRVYCFAMHRAISFLSLDSFSSATEFVVTTVQHSVSEASFTLPSIAVTGKPK
jgi:hypothetical protein